jgi:hypothetical protein
MDIVEFLEARIDEEEAELRHVDFDAPSSASSLASKLLAECAQKRAILANWKRTVPGRGISDTAVTQADLALAHRSMLGILAAGYRAHPDFNPDWCVR